MLPSGWHPMSPRWIFLLPIALGLLASCGIAAGNRISSMDAASIAQVSDAEVCHPMATGAVVQAERQRRDLADCDPAHLKCHSMGYKTGTAEYLQCRQMFIQQDIAQAAAYESARQQMISNIQRAYQEPPPTTSSTTTCSPNGTDVTCQTRLR
jgi:hypothetical protein